MKIRSILVLINLIIHAAAGISYAACTFRTTATPMNFGNLSPANNTDVTATSTVRIRCTPPSPNPSPYTMSDNNGLYYGGAPPSHRMRNDVVPTEFLPYEIA